MRGLFLLTVYKACDKLLIGSRYVQWLLPNLICYKGLSIY